MHQLQQDRYGSQHLSADLILSEGMATWGAGVYWLGEHPDFRRYVRAQRTNGISYPLATHYAGRGVAVMNALYYSVKHESLDTNVSVSCGHWRW